MTLSKPDAKHHARRKGNEFQSWIRRWLEERGWVVRNFPVSVQPRKTPKGLIYCGQKLDVWGADLVARKFINGQTELLWIQASCSGGISKRIGEFSEYFTSLCPGEHLQIWIKAKDGAVNIHHSDCPMMGANLVGKIIRGNFYRKLSGGPDFGGIEEAIP